MKMRKKGTCIDCGAPIKITAVRCRSCANKGANNPMYKNGKYVSTKPVVAHNVTVDEPQPKQSQPKQLLKPFDLENEKLKNYIKDLKKENTLLRKQKVTDDEVRTRILEIKSSDPVIPDWTQKFSQGSGGMTGVPTIQLSDWHLGETVFPEQVFGKNEYNLEIGKERARNLCYNLIDVLNNHLYSESGYPGIVVLLNGDFFSGDIHEELTATNDKPIMPCFIEAHGILIWFLQQLLDEFGNVMVFCAAGNHSRITKKMPFKNMNHTNFDWLLYQMLDKSFAENKNINFSIATGSDIQFKIYNHKYRMTHGGQFRGGQGFIGPYAPITRGEMKKRAAAETYGESYDTLVIGHFHQLMTLNRVIVNGCFPAGSCVTMFNGDTKPIEDVVLGDKVITDKGNIKEVNHVFIRKHEGEMINIRCGSTYQELSCTPNHKIKVIKSNAMGVQIPINGKYEKFESATKEFDWIPAEYLSVGDYVNIPFNKNVDYTQTISKEFARFIGLYLAEGSSSGRDGKLHHSNFSFHRKEEGFANFVVNIANQRYGSGSHILPNGRPNSREVQIYRKECALEMTDLCGRGCAEKRCKNFLMTLDPNIQKEILIGWIQGDGHIYRNTKIYRNGRCVSATTISKQLITQMEIIAARCGLRFSTTSNNLNNQDRRTSYTIAFHGDDAMILSSWLGEPLPEAKRTLNFSSLWVNGELYRRITHVWRTPFNDNVYNLTVDDDHTYVISGMAVHNSLIGYNEMAMDCNFPYEPPRQALWITHPKRGITVNMPIYCDSRDVKTEKSSWVSWAE